MSFDSGMELAPGRRESVRTAPPEMISERLDILLVSSMPPSPPRFGAQARVHGLFTELARRHDVTAVVLHDEEFDRAECERAMRAWCREVVLLPNPGGRDGRTKRLMQLRSLASLDSYERHRHAVPGLQAALDRVTSARRFDVVNLEFPFLAHYRLRGSPPGTPEPALVLDAHDIAYRITRQVAEGETGLVRRVYAALNWRKLRREELAAFRAADAVAVCSELDRARLLEDLPGVRAEVIPNAADVERFRPRAGDPRPDGRTVLYFGLLATAPNIDGLRFFVREIWPRVLARRPGARFRIVGARPPPAVKELAGGSVDLAGFVEDLRPELAAAAAVVVPLRLGSGTRLKIVEALAMGKGVVSTRLGAEGLATEHDRHILLADEPERFADQVVRLLEDPATAERLGEEGRRLAVERYAWSSAARALEALYRQVISAREQAAAPARRAS